MPQEILLDIVNKAGELLSEHPDKFKVRDVRSNCGEIITDTDTPRGSMRIRMRAYRGSGSSGDYREAEVLIHKPTEGLNVPDWSHRTSISTTKPGGFIGDSGNYLTHPTLFRPLFLDSMTAETTISDDEALELLSGCENIRLPSDGKYNDYPSYDEVRVEREERGTVLSDLEVFF